MRLAFRIAAPAPVALSLILARPLVAQVDHAHQGEHIGPDGLNRLAQGDDRVTLAFPHTLQASQVSIDGPRKDTNQ